MSLSSIGCQQHPIVARGLEFLFSSIRADSSWAIENHRAAWITTLAVNSLAVDFASALADDVIHHQSGTRSASAYHRPWDDTEHLGNASIETADAESVRQTHSQNAMPHTVENDFVLDERCLNWLLDSQYSQANAVTDVPPGGWSWSDSPGALPNSLATASALLALAHWRRRFAQLDLKRIDQAADRGITWIIGLQNDDGGWPTFYRDGSSFQFETSASDTTCYVLRALWTWDGLRQTAAPRPESTRAPAGAGKLIATAIQRGVGYLERQQRDDGSFIPLWFGNEHHAMGINPVYGTAQVLMACAELGRLDTEMVSRAAGWLVSAQHAGGGWGPPRAPLDYSNTEKDGFRAWRANESLAKFSTVEETGLAVAALLPMATTNHAVGRAVSSGLAWLATAVEQDAHRQGAVVGFYPGRLWYHERLYPLVFAAGALSQAVRHLEPQRQTATPLS
jgi:squalene-hopene/tetraprenyl-beta-curcumene cyclase